MQPGQAVWVIKPVAFELGSVARVADSATLTSEWQPRYPNARRAKHRPVLLLGPPGVAQTFKGQDARSMSSALAGFADSPAFEKEE